MNNIAKHAQATNVVLKLEGSPQQVQLTIADNGCGFDVTKPPLGRLGMSIMRERAKSIQAGLIINSKVDQGTETIVTWPKIN